MKAAWRAKAISIVTVGIGTLASAPPALAATPAECVAASDRGQAKRDEGHLLASRAELVACAADSCPAIVKRECSRWLGEVDERIPSLVVSVKESSGKDVLGAEVSVDGKPVAVAGAGRAFQLDPGTHVVRAVVRGRAPIEETIVARERERDRTVTLFLAPVGPLAGERPTERSNEVPVLSWVLGGVAVVGGGAFAYFWATGLDRVSELRSSCAPYCSAEQIDDARVPLTTARIALGVGIVAAVAAVTVYVLRPPAASASRPAAAARAPLTFSF